MWFRVSDDAAQHPKIVRLVSERGGLAAFGFWALCGAYCARFGTDGQISAAEALHTSGKRRRADVDKIAARLVAVGLWEPSGDGWQFVNWHRYNQTQAQRDAAKQANTESKRRSRAEKRAKSAREVHETITKTDTKRAPKAHEMSTKSARDVPQNYAERPRSLAIPQAVTDDASRARAWSNSNSNTNPINEYIPYAISELPKLHPRALGFAELIPPERARELFAEELVVEMAAAWANRVHLTWTLRSQRKRIDDKALPAFRLMAQQIAEQRGEPCGLHEAIWCALIGFEHDQQAKDQGWILPFFLNEPGRYRRSYVRRAQAERARLDEKKRDDEQFAAAAEVPDPQTVAGIIDQIKRTVTA